jgi:hypothetical protein
MGVPKLSHRARTVKSETTAAEPPGTRNRAREGGGCGFGNRGHHDDCSLSCIAAPNLKKRNGEPKSIRRSLQKLPATLYIEPLFECSKAGVPSTSPRLRIERHVKSKVTAAVPPRTRSRAREDEEVQLRKSRNLATGSTTRRHTENAWPSSRLFCGRTVAGRSAKRSANSDAVGKDGRV